MDNPIDRETQETVSTLFRLCSNSGVAKTENHQQEQDQVHEAEIYDGQEDQHQRP